MRRRVLFLFLAVLVFAVGGCGKKEATEEQAAVSGEPGSIAGQLPPSDVTAKPGDTMIEPSGQDIPVEGLFLNPFFDEAGTKTELAVAPGEQFQMSVFGETVEPYQTNAVQYRLLLPDGVEIVSSSEFEMKSISMGDPKYNYMLAYACQPPSRFRLVTYTCRATPEFQGGEVQVLDGVPGGNGVNFIGFVSCEFVEMRATGGTATLTRK